MRIQILAITASVFFILLVLSLIRKRKLREEYALIWFVGGALLILFALWRNLLDMLADLVGVFYAPTILLLVGLFVGAISLLHFSVVISRHSDENKSLAQELALLKERLRQLEDRPV
ncbi:MAG: DUF2304 domain-containing protein [Candidatus Zixiibacteriota bacterium]|nr:MAG: DUF2304 domain-containing protein [candidate division Zixibacteria bacterium]